MSSPAVKRRAPTLNLMPTDCSGRLLRVAGSSRIARMSVRSARCGSTCPGAGPPVDVGAGGDCAQPDSTTMLTMTAAQDRPNRMALPPRRTALRSTPTAVILRHRLPGYNREGGLDRDGSGTERGEHWY